MASRFDYRDPGQDEAYCDAISPEPEPEHCCVWCGQWFESTADDNEPYCSALCGRYAMIDDEECGGGE